MRVIERQMNKAISTETDWKKDNTQVVNIGGVSFVYLYSNLIAMVGDTWLELFDGGYKSSTTKSRLNAILSEHGNSEYIYQKNFNWFVSTKYGDIPFNNGIKLNWVMNTYQHQLSVKIADTLEKLQYLNPELYGERYSKLYAPHGDIANWTESMLHQIEQDLIDNAKWTIKVDL